MSYFITSSALRPVFLYQYAVIRTLLVRSPRREKSFWWRGDTHHCDDLEQKKHATKARPLIRNRLAEFPWLKLPMGEIPFCKTPRTTSTPFHTDLKWNYKGNAGSERIDAHRTDCGRLLLTERRWANLEEGAHHFSIT